MEKQSALHIIQALAEGIDPHTGEAFPATSPYQHPDTVRALFKAIDALGQPQLSRPSQNAHENAGKPWSNEEDQVLAAEFESGKAIPQLAEHHGRSRAAIQARLIRLGKIEPPADGPRFRIAPAAHASAGQ